MSDGLGYHEVGEATLRKILAAVEPFATVGVALYASALPEDHHMGSVSDGRGGTHGLTKGQLKAAHAARCRIREALEGSVRRPPPGSAEVLGAEVERLTRIVGRIEDAGEGADVVQRLRGRYPVGPHLPNGDPEFGWRQFQATPINLEAALVIEELRTMLAASEEVVRQLVDDRGATRPVAP